jgi:hypothetical protein
MLQAVRTSETSGNIYETTRRWSNYFARHIEQLRSGCKSLVENPDGKKVATWDSSVGGEMTAGFVLMEQTILVLSGFNRLRINSSDESL